MVEKIPQHSHCQICGKAIPVDERFCSDKCEEEYDEYVKKRKRWMYLMWGALAVLMIVFILSFTSI